MKTNRIEIIISGIGGQGVVYSANLLGSAALYRHKFSSSIAHYGPESRGSVTTSEVIISNPSGRARFPTVPKDGSFGGTNPTKTFNSDLDYPCVESPDIFIAMHQKGYDYHITSHRLHRLNLKYLIYDSTLVTIPKTTMPHMGNLNLIAIPASQLAKEELKNIMMANIILTAALVKATGIITRNNLERALKEMAPP
ncbi:MAG: 2-oxoacid:acceptor oxidoreductase family protein, partial [Planctomycetota bacterium]